jgi:uncharacterized protein
LEEEIIFQGHESILSLHPKTIEITKDPHLTKKGDCIVGVSANKGCDDLDIGLRQKLRTSGNVVKIGIIVEPFQFNLAGLGSDNLEITHKHDIVLRKSSYVDSRTLIVSCDKSAIDIPRKLINALTNSEAKGLLRIKVE